MRVVSLLASATEIVCELGAGEMLVGRSHECDSPDWVRELPQCSRPAFDISASSGAIDREVKRRIRCGEPLYHVDTDLIRELRPDLVLTQVHCDVCAVTPRDVGSSFRQLRLSASSVAEIFESIRQIAGGLGRPQKGADLVRQMEVRLDELRQRTANCKGPKVAVIEWTDPLFSSGNWVPELVRIAHGEPVIGRAGEPSAGIEFEQLRLADPDVVIVAPCGFSLDRALQDREVLESYDGWRDLRAVAFADGNRYFNRSGITIVRTAEILAEILAGNQGGHGGAHGSEWQWAS